MRGALLALLLVASLSACDRNGHDVKGGI
ncbi:MAG: hypothetical protein JWP22_3855, partial [Ramlibacter sp.]|nr:hypothetical protein [Ramlibacter sp.]